jgi:hypothetical protein
MDVSWAKIKRRQADDADNLAAVASGIGEYAIANACYRLAAILRREAVAIETADAREDDWVRRSLGCPEDDMPDGPGG